MKELLGLRAGLLRTTKIFKFDPKYVSDSKWQAELALIDEIAAEVDHVHIQQHDRERYDTIQLVSLYFSPTVQSSSHPISMLVVVAFCMWLSAGTYSTVCLSPVYKIEVLLFSQKLWTDCERTCGLFATTCSHTMDDAHARTGSADEITFSISQVSFTKIANAVATYGWCVSHSNSRSSLLW